MNRIDKACLIGMCCLIIVLLFKPFDNHKVVYTNRRYNTVPLIVKKANRNSAETLVNVTVCVYNGIGNTKSWMDGRAITDTSSKQYQLINSDMIELNSNGHYIYYDEKLNREYLGVAMSSIYGNVGDKFKITLNDNTILYVIMLDCKAFHEVDECGSHSDGSIVEFVMHKELLYEAYENFNGGLQMYEPFQGDIVKIERIIENEV